MLTSPLAVGVRSSYRYAVSTDDNDHELGDPGSAVSAPHQRKRGSRTLLVVLAVAAVGAVVAAVFFLPSYLVENDLGSRARDGLTTSELLDAKNNVRTTLLQAVGGLILLAGAVATWSQLRLGRERLDVTQRQNRDQQRFASEELRLSRESQLAERFTRAIDQLGSKELGIRLGAIYALERIASDSKDDHGPVTEILTAFLREPPHSHHWAGSEGATDQSETDDAEHRLRADLQAAATAIGHLNATRVPPERRLNLTGVRLRYADLRSANLERVKLNEADLSFARFREAILRAADLQRAVLQGARLQEADLRGAELQYANLEGAILAQANLQEAKLAHAHLESADLVGASLNDAYLGSAILERVDLSGAKLIGAHLEQANLEGAHLERAELQGARMFDVELVGAHLQGANLRDAVQLGQANLRDSRASKETVWPDGFDPEAAGVVIESE